MSTEASADFDAPPEAGQEEEDMLFESALFEARFEDLPSVKEVKALIAARGYGERDPLNVLIEVYGKFDARQAALTNRLLLSTTKNADAVATFHEAVLQGSKEWQASHDVLKQCQEKIVALEQQIDALLDYQEKLIPALNKAGGEVVRAAELIENRSLKAVVLSYLAPFLSFIAGWATAVFTR